MAIKLIVTDMDGTLLDYDDKISKQNCEALIKCQQNGIKVILASGRSFRRLLPYADILELEKYDGAFIEVNGMAMYYPKSKQRIIYEQLPRNEVIQLCEFLSSYQIELQIYLDDGIYFYIPDSIVPYKIKERIERNLPEDYPWVSGPWSWVNDSRNGYPRQIQIKNFNEIKEASFNKLNLSQDPVVLDRIIDELRINLQEHYQIVRTCPRMIEIAPKNISKGITLARYMQYMGIKKEEVMVFGDGENDLDMFSVCDYSIAMDNASELVKKHAKFITASNIENGIAKAINKYIFR